MILEIANDEMEKLESELAKIHIKAFETADAEKIKSLVALILNIQQEAVKFRKDLSDFADKYNERNNNTLVFNPSKCYLVTPELANEIGAKKLEKIKSDVASHTVFTGILTTDIRNLEIYYRCIVMFFEKSRAKYDYLMENAENFVVLAGILEEGNYTSIQGTKNTAEKLKITAYPFLEESLKDDEGTDDTTVKSVVVIKEEPAEELLVEDIQVTDDIPTTEEVEIDTVDIIETDDTVIEEITDLGEINEPENEPVTEDNLSFEDTPAQQHSVSEPVLEADTVTDLPNTNISLGNIFGSTSDDNNSPEETDSDDNAEDITSEEVSEELEANRTAKTQEYPELSKEEQDDIARHERFKEIKTVNTETEEFQKLASKFDRARKNDPDRETTLVPKKNNKPKIFIAIAVIVVVIIAINAIRFLPGFIVETKYNSAVELQENKNYSEAITKFQELGDYEDSEKRIKECKYQNALLLIEAEDFSGAKGLLSELKGYNTDIETKLQICDYSIAKKYLEKGKYDKAEELFKELGDYGDSKEMIKECSYRKALSFIEGKKYTEAIEILSTMKKYSEASEKINEAKYLYVTENLSAENETTVKYLKELAKANYRNSADLKTELLGTSGDSSLKFFVNEASTDTTTTVDSVSHLRSAYFHVIALDESYYGETLTIKYTTQYNYSASDTVTFSENNTSTVFVYPPTTTSGYTVTFSIHTADGTTIGSQKITIS